MTMNRTGEPHYGEVSCDVVWDAKTNTLTIQVQGLPNSIPALLAARYAIEYSLEEDKKRQGLAEAELEVVKAQVFYTEDDGG